MGTAAMSALPEADRNAAIDPARLHAAVDAFYDSDGNSLQGVRAAIIAWEASNPAVERAATVCIPQADKPADRYSAEPANRDGSRWLIRYSPNPGGTKNADGSVTHSLSFPALQLTDYVGSQEDAAKAITHELNCHDEMRAALAAWDEAYPNDEEDCSISDLWGRYGSQFAHAMDLTRKALSKVVAA